MTKHANQRTSVSTLMGAPIGASDGRALGAVREFAVLPSEDACHIFGVIVRHKDHRKQRPASLVRIADLVLSQTRAFNSATKPNPSKSR